MAIYGIAKRAYRICVPDNMRLRLSASSGPVASLVRWMRTQLSARAAHDELYDERYFRTTVDQPSVASADAIAESLIGTFQPKSVIDVGCGTGALLEAFARRSVSTLGLELAKAAIQVARARGLRIIPTDLEDPPASFAMSFDLAISLEVAEHLPENVPPAT